MLCQLSANGTAHTRAWVHKACQSAGAGCLSKVQLQGAESSGKISFSDLFITTRSEKMFNFNFFFFYGIIVLFFFTSAIISVLQT